MRRTMGFQAAPRQNCPSELVQLARRPRLLTVLSDCLQAALPAFTPGGLLSFMQRELLRCALSLCCDLLPS